MSILGFAALWVIGGSAVGFGLAKVLAFGSACDERLELSAPVIADDLLQHGAGGGEPRFLGRLSRSGVVLTHAEDSYL